MVPSWPRLAIGPGLARKTSEHVRRHLISKRFDGRTGGWDRDGHGRCDRPLWDEPVADFLTSPAIEDAVGRLLQGRDLRLAVAFWGSGASGAMFGGSPPPSARLICDVTMGGSNPRELEVLGAPSNPNLRHLPGFHAKVHLSDLGVVIGSANASSKGLGFGLGFGVAHVEAATLHSTADPVFAAAAAWFETMWRRSVQGDEEALLAGRRAWGRRPPPPPTGEPDPRPSWPTRPGFAALASSSRRRTPPGRSATRGFERRWPETAHPRCGSSRGRSGRQWPLGP